MAEKNWIDTMLDLNKNLEKKAAAIPQGKDKEEHEANKLSTNAWIAEVAELNVEAIEAEYNEKLAEEARMLGKTIEAEEEWCKNCEHYRSQHNEEDSGVGSCDMQNCNCKSYKKASLNKQASEEFKTNEQVIESDYQRQLHAYSDSNLMELLALARAHKDNVSMEKFAEYKEEAKKSVESSRKSAENELLKLTGKHTLLDWRDAFTKFSKEAEVKQPSEKELYQPKVTEKEADFSKPSEDKFKMPTEKEMVPEGNGREADQRTEVTKQAIPVQKEASIKVEAEYKGFVTKNGNYLQVQYIPENDLLVVDLVSADESIGNEIVRMRLNEDELLSHRESSKKNNIVKIASCPVCGGEGKDLQNGQKDSLACMACGITYADQIKPVASKEEVIKMVKEANQSPWQVVKQEDGTEVIARVETPDTISKSSEEDTKEDLQK